LGPLIFIVVMLLLMWLLLVRPQRKRQVEQAELLGSLEIGDEIVTAGGLYGYVEVIGDDEVTIEVAPGTNVRIAKRAVAAVLTEEVDEEEDETAEREATGEEDAAPAAQGSDEGTSVEPKPGSSAQAPS